MKLLTPAQIRLWDAYTVEHEPVSDYNLMERAASKAASFILAEYSSHKSAIIFCGSGNNGADGLVISRLLLAAGLKVRTILIGSLAGQEILTNNPGKFTPDTETSLADEKTGFPPEAPAKASLFTTSLEQLRVCLGAEISVFEQGTLPAFEPRTLIIDAIFGTAQRLPLPAPVAGLISQINETRADHKAALVLISIDVPTGLPADFCNPPEQIPFRADLTLSFQLPKPSFLLPDTGLYCGRLIILDIGLDLFFTENQQGSYYLTDRDSVNSFFRKRTTFAHKGTYGHSLIIAGSKGKCGAAVLASTACLHAGAGLVTAFIPGRALEILQASTPEVMVLTSKENDYTTDFVQELKPYNAIAIGPGLGQHPDTKSALLDLLKSYTGRLVLDADALNILSGIEGWAILVPEGSILTPHVGEFERLAGKSESAYERLRKQQQLARQTRSVIILKGACTSVCFPNGETWFNTTGNPGMATGGSGDTLTGILCALLSQGYKPEDASCLGVYIHGRAADLAVEKCGETYLAARNIIESLGLAFLELEKDAVYQY